MSKVTPIYGTVLKHFWKWCLSVFAYKLFKYTPIFQGKKLISSTVRQFLFKMLLKIDLFRI